MKSIYAFSRRFFGIATSILLLMAARNSFCVPDDLPTWRTLLGIAFLFGGALVFEQFVSDGKE